MTNENTILNYEEKKAIAEILKRAMNELGNKEFKYSINVSTHIFYNYVRNKPLREGIKVLRDETIEPYNYYSHWFSLSYEQNKYISSYLSEIEKYIDKERLKELYSYFIKNI